MFSIRNLKSTTKSFASECYTNFHLNRSAVLSSQSILTAISKTKQKKKINEDTHSEETSLC